MRSLLLLRHAHSGWAEDRQPDEERPLSARGEEGADLMGRFIARRPLPELVLCSAAKRARQTLERVVASWPSQPPSEIEEDLYLASTGQLLARCQALGDAVTRVLIVGHNPGIGALAAGLAGSGPPDELAALQRKFPTAALAEISFELRTWADLAPRAGALQCFATPKRLAGAQPP